VVDSRLIAFCRASPAIAASFLVLLRVRAKGGRATTEAFPEDAVRRELERAA